MYGPDAELDRTLLYSLSQLPVKQFSEVVISIAVGCWQWLIASRPDLEYRVKGHHTKKTLINFVLGA